MYLLYVLVVCTIYMYKLYVKDKFIGAICNIIELD